LVGGTVLQKAGATIASFDTTTSGQLAITFTNANGQTPTSTDVDNILRQITYANSSDAPPASAQIDWSFDDGNTGSQGTGGALQAPGSTTVTITAVNDAPSFTKPNFASATISTTADEANDVHVADVDGDGDLDVLSASFLDDTITWYENDGNENFTEHTIYALADGAASVTTADVDGDGDLDVLSASRNDDSINWYENDGNENFTAHNITAVAGGANAVNVADVDGDGDIDVLVANAYSGTFSWYENDGNENFTAQTISSICVADAVAVDVDADGDMDILSTGYYSGNLTWHENDGNENFTDHTIDTLSTGSEPAGSVHVADVDDDGDLDVLTNVYVDDKINWYENDGSENFTAHTITAAADGASSVGTADVDGDGDLDVLSASELDDTIAWYENDGNENFTARTITTGADGARNVAAADLDGDGDVDLLSASALDDKIAWYENAPVSTLDGTPNFTEGGAAVVLDADVDISDIELDALSSGNGNYNGATLTLLRNGGANADDLFSHSGLLSALTESGALVYNGTTIGTVTTNSAGTLLLTFDANATSTLVDSTLKAIAYANSSDAPPATAQIDWTFDDGNSGTQGTGGALQATGSTTVTITAENNAPVVTASGGVTSYSEQATATVIDSAISINDPDGFGGVDPSNQYVANIQITGNYEATDILGFSDTANIQGNLVGDTLTLTVVGGQTASVAEFQAALRTVTFYNGSDMPSELNRTISFYFDDGVDSSNVSTKTVQVTAVNDAPTVSATATNPTHTEGDAVVDLFNTVSVSTVEGGQTIEQIVLTVTNVTDGSDETMTIDGSVVLLVNGDNDSTGSGYDYMVDVVGNTATITIDTVGASVVDAQTLIDGFGYQNSSLNPTEASRAITITGLTDSGGGTDTSTPNITRTVDVVALSAAPTIALPVG
ncbi:MAG: hypothetical protein GY722_04580, partial [bacterium]|nr:hypothetical protein [bacterium]